MARVKKNRISVLNWMATLLVCAIPGVNIMDTIVVRRDETFPLNNEMLEAMAKDHDQVDL